MIKGCARDRCNTGQLNQFQAEPEIHALALFRLQPSHTRHLAYDRFGNFFCDLRKRVQTALRFGYFWQAMNSMSSRDSVFSFLFQANPEKFFIGRCCFQSRMHPNSEFPILRFVKFVGLKLHFQPINFYRFRLHLTINSAMVYWPHKKLRPVTRFTSQPIVKNV